MLPVAVLRLESVEEDSETFEDVLDERNAVIFCRQGRKDQDKFVQLYQHLAMGETTFNRLTVL